MQVLTGRCLCEGVAYEIRGELGPIFNCHCSNCRRWHGAAFRTRATIQASQFSWTRGEELLARHHSSEFVVKHFCRVCGSNLISTYDNDPARIGIPLGGLDQAPTNRPEGHIWVGSKAPWYEITDGLPEHETWPGSHAKVRETSGDPPRQVAPSAPVVHVGLAEALRKGPPPVGNLAVPIFARGSLVAELYTPKDHDPQKPHARDEIYLVARGTAAFFDGERRYRVEPGSFVFVAAGQPHRFEDFSPDFATWVFFYGPERGTSIP